MSLSYRGQRSNTVIGSCDWRPVIRIIAVVSAAVWQWHGVLAVKRQPAELKCPPRESFADS